MKRRDLILGGFAVAGLGGWAWTSGLLQPQGAAPSETILPGAANAQTSSSDFDTSTIPEMVLGNPDSPVTLIEYASFTCPHCASFHTGAFKQLKEEYIDTNKIKFVYREIYFDRPGLWASMVARCGGGEKFFGISDLIYKGQSQWARAGDPAQIAEELRKIGRLAGLDDETLDSCMQNAEMAQTLVAWSQENSQMHEVQATPSLNLNGTTHRNMAYGALKNLIDAELEG